MKTIQTLGNEKYKAIIKETQEGRFFVQCTQDGNATHGFHFKYYNTFKGAEKYANTFVTTNA